MDSIDKLNVDVLVGADGLIEKIAGNFYTNDDAVEHGDYWDTAICFKMKNSEGMYGVDEMILLECGKEDAEFIITALNSKLNNSR